MKNRPIIGIKATVELDNGTVINVKSAEGNPSVIEVEGNNAMNMISRRMDKNPDPAKDEAEREFLRGAEVALKEALNAKGLSTEPGETNHAAGKAIPAVLAKHKIDTIKEAAQEVFGGQLKRVNGTPVEADLAKADELSAARR